MRAIIVSAVLAALLAAAPASAQTPSLTGEDLLARDFEGFPTADIGEVDVVARQCNADGSGSFEFTASGPAAGPYPGTFQESGSVAFGPGAHGESQVTAFQATFTIDSPAGQVTGTKTLADVPSGFTGCREVGDQEFLAAATAAAYEATIVLPSGARCTDSGTAETSVTSNDFGAGGGSSENFSEVFASDQAAAVCAPAGPRNCTRDSAGFKNRGDCVAFFATEGSNEPGRNVPGPPPHAASRR